MAYCDDTHVKSSDGLCDQRYLHAQLAICTKLPRKTNKSDVARMNKRNFFLQASRTRGTMSFAGCCFGGCVGLGFSAQRPKNRAPKGVPSKREQTCSRRSSSSVPRGMFQDEKGRSYPQQMWSPLLDRSRKAD
ncbi:hypothetical protein KVR01_010719 [Diaporthe batatas]|uniref:uncharacterized protein n=1 Tax=Diaporthe batatas TaxID=748121 RepID=UPI001D03BCF0|nr:uncharacterized protein KVR01_010719 [Diaporthe batatas]KAG8160082.1 hypothetical protein KVR01_010719 [Diaporthe batatas]